MLLPLYKLATGDISSGFRISLGALVFKMSNVELN